MKPNQLTSRAGVAAVAAAALGLHMAGGFEWAERHLMDLRFALARGAPTGQVVVVAVDPRSLDALDVWPWPRGYHATVLENLVAAGARRIAFDVDFSSRSSEEEDAAFAEALAEARGQVILPVFRQWQASPVEGQGRMVETRPLASFAPPASLATINIQPDGDGLVRRYGSFDAADAARPAPLAMSLAGLDRERRAFHLDFGLDVTAIRQVSYLDVLTGTFDPAAFSGRDVVVGATALELGDQAPVPMHAALPGPVLQALAYESLVTGRTLTRLPAWHVAVLILLLAAAAGLPMQRVSWRAGLGILAAGLAGSFWLSVALQRSAPILLDLSPVAACLAGWYGLALVRRLDHLDLKLWLASMRARHSELRMQHVVENCGEAIVTLDGSGRVQTFNRAAEGLFGLRGAQVLGRPFADLTGAAPSIARQEIEVVRPDGAARTLDMSLSHPDLDGPPVSVVFLRDVTDSRAQQAALQHQATHDALTDLPNRTLLRRRMRDLLGEAPASGARGALIMLDLDRFKEINDTLGHTTGDVLLRQLAARLKDCLGPQATIARLGGDEFAVWLPHAGTVEAESASTSLLGTLTAPFSVQGMMLQVDGSAGIALYPDHGAEDGVLLQRADVAMYQAKKIRGSFCFYDADSDLNSLRHLTLKGEMREAIEKNLFELYYQPKVDLATGAMVGVEALLRWRHHRHGWLQPQEFIPLAERTGLIRPLTRWVLGEALAQVARWEREGLTLTVAVNCSARNLLERDLPDVIEQLLRPGIDPGRLVLEITETAVIEDPSRSLQVLRDVTALGVHLSIDDFGTAYSSLDYLRKLPARELKIDRSFVMGVDHDEASASIVRATVRLAHDFGLQSVAEGIESQRTMESLARMGCDQGQGFLIARPMPAGDVLPWQTARQRRAGDRTVQARV
ncbi:MAG: EAL domain-containing protein [Candidatus Polarisedimenticolia bacterium]